MTPGEAHAVYALAWLSFGLGHSWLAGDAVKRRMAPWLGPYYRLSYNLIAATHVALIFAVGAWVLDGGRAVAGVAAWRPVMTLAGIGGWLLLVLVLRTYDLGLLAGTAQIRAHRQGRPADAVEPMITSGFHAYVRHPLYAAAFVILWGAAWTDLALATAVWGSAYLVIGARFEERRLERLYGDAYRAYRARVPAFIPWRGRAV